MKVEQFSLDQLRTLLAGSGLRVKAGPFNLSIQTCLPSLTDQLYRMYSHRWWMKQKLLNFMFE
ncbi:MAG TPA: hypothetical protein PKI25_10000 [Nitrosomonas europaea]|nr:hypothetical protein [Nitrosomonas europaea]